MRKLLSAGFMRLWKSRVFWLVFAGSILSSLVVFYTTYSTFVKFDSFLCTPEELMFNFTPVMLFACPIFICLFQGTEYSDGTVRNKLISGHRRQSIYFSALTVCFTGLALILVVNYALMYVLGLLFLTPGNMAAGSLLYEALCSLLAVLALSAVCLLVTMSCQRKAAGVVLCIVVIVATLMASSWLDSQLREGEMTSMGMVIHEDGTMEWLQPEPNPLYISGPARTVMEFAEDLLPTGQILRASNTEFSRSERWPVLSLAFAAAMSAGGVTVFKKKDIK